MYIHTHILTHIHARVCLSAHPPGVGSGKAHVQACSFHFCFVLHVPFYLNTNARMNVPVGILTNKRCNTRTSIQGL
jgi:hypothetical protein